MSDLMVDCALLLAAAVGLPAVDAAEAVQWPLRHTQQRPWPSSALKAPAPDPSPIP